ncbi:MAG TPA: hypothetical protein VMY42_19775 [Thermoguttaceae bacterium]|nr:hypothetical protein [Thermoguttaceae bacterium]
MLNGAGWVGTAIHDNDGDLFTVNMDDLSVAHVGRMNQVMFDLAFSPTGQLYGISGPEIPTRLFTVDIDFDNLPAPGAPIPTTLIGAITDATGNVALNSLEFRSDGTLFAVGFNALHQEFVYTIDTTTAAGKAELSVAGHQSAGDVAFDLDGNLYVTTFAGKLVRIDPALTTVEVAGDLPGGDFFGLTYGPSPMLHGFRYLQEEIYEVHDITTADATTTKVGELAHPELDGINGAANTILPPADLGQVDFLELAGQQPVGGELWYRVEAAHDGYLTVQTPDASGTQVTLYSQDVGGALSELASGNLRADFPVALGGNQYFVHIGGASAGVGVRVTNLVKTDGSKTDVQGTAADDDFEFRPGASPRVTINGVDYALPVIAGQDLDVEYHGAAGDSAVLYGSATDGDRLVSTITFAELVGSGFKVTARGCTDLLIDGRAGGGDMAKVYGSPRNDILGVSDSSLQLEALQYGYKIVVRAYTITHTYGGDGYDIAKMYDSTGDDRFETNWYQGVMFSEKYFNRAKDFEVIHGYASPGSDGRGYDVAVMGDSAGDDTFDATPIESVMSNPKMYMRAKQFEEVTAKATEGGIDRANLHDSAGNDLFVGVPTSGQMSGPGYQNTARFFDSVVADSTGGVDVAKLFDSAGADEFVADPLQATLSGPGYSNQVKKFKGVHAYATAGGRDKAWLSGSLGQDTFKGDYYQGAMYDGLTFYNRAKHFEEVYAQAGAGNDRAVLTDSIENDYLQANGNWVKLSCAALNFMHDTQGFQRVEAGSSNAGDTSDIGPNQFGLDWVFTNWP